MQIKYQTEIISIDGYWELFETTGWNNDYQISKQDLADVLKKSWYYLAAYDGDRLVGFGRVSTDGILHAMIYDLITDPEYQAHGIGTEILSRLVKKCKDENIRDIQLFCAKGKRIFYEKRGFVARGVESPGMEYKILKENCSRGK